MKEVCHIWYVGVLRTNIYRQCMPLIFDHWHIDILRIYTPLGMVCANAGRDILEGRLGPPGAE